MQHNLTKVRITNELWLKTRKCHTNESLVKFANLMWMSDLEIEIMTVIKNLFFFPGKFTRKRYTEREDPDERESI